jgi:hypothetical protein
MNNEPQRIDPDTGSAIFQCTAPGSHMLDAPVPESARTGAAAAAVHDDPKRHIPAHWLHHPAGLPAQQDSPGPTPDAIELLSDLEEASPHAIALLCRVWGKPEAARAFRALFLTADGRVRRWSQDAWAELVLMGNLHQSLYPCPAPDAGAALGVAVMPDPTSLPELEVGYGHVVDRLLKCWGNVEAFAVVHHDLVFDSRGDRAGWPAEVWSDLLLLQEIHDEAYGMLPPGAEP